MRAGLYVELDAGQLRQLRLRSQQLLGDRPNQPGQIGGLVDRVGGIQAQDVSAAERGIWARTAGLTAAQLEAQRVNRRSIVRTWAMRGTLHLLPRRMLAPALAAFGLRFIRTAKSRYKQLGLTEPVMQRAVEVIDRSLAELGPLVRSQIADELAAQKLPYEGQVTFHLIRRAAFLGRVCYGPDLEGETAFVRLEDWLGEQPNEPEAEAAQGELADWYLQAFGPAGVEDFAAWSGLPITSARKAFAASGADRLDLTYGGQLLLMPADRAGWLDELSKPAGDLKLLPAFDSYLLAYRDRALSVPEQFARQVHPGGGIIRPTLMIDGVATGIWRARRRGSRLAVELQPFEALSSQQLDLVANLAEDLGRLHDMRAEFRLADPA